MNDDAQVVVALNLKQQAQLSRTGMVPIHPLIFSLARYVTIVYSNSSSAHGADLQRIDFQQLLKKGNVLMDAHGP
jgi:hypothetical protein